MRLKISLLIATSLICVVHVTVADPLTGPSNALCASADATGAAQALPAPWDIDNDPFGRMENGRCLSAYSEPTEIQMDSVLDDPEVQRLIKAHRLISISLPSLAKLTDAGLARLASIEGLSGLSLDADRNRTLDPGFARLKQMDWLEALEIIGDGLSDNDLESLSRFKRLRVLKLGTAVNVTGSGLTFLKASRQLEFLELNANKLNDAGLNSLGQWPNLSRLALGEPWGLRALFEVSHSMRQNPSWLGVQKGGGPNINRGMENLRQLPNLRQLDLNCVNVTDSGLTPIRGLARLETLRLSGLNASEDGLANLETLTNLRSLVIRDMSTPGRTLLYLRKLPHLEELTLERTNLTNAEAPHLAGMAGLKRLRITMHGWASADPTEPLSDGGALAGALKTMPKLAEFELTDYRDVGDSLMPAFSGLTDLKRLRLADVSITDEGLRQIAPLARLEVLEIAPVREHFLDSSTNVFSDPSPVTDKGMKYVKSLARLQVLNIADTDVTDKGLAELKDLTQLRKLSLPGTISDAGIEQLGNMRDLEEIRVAGKKPTAKAAKFLFDHCHKLKTADFSGAQYVRDGELHLDDP